MKIGIQLVVALLHAGIPLSGLVAQGSGSGVHVDPLDIPCAGRVVLRNDSSRDEEVSVTMPGDTLSVLVRARRAGQSYAATTLFLGESGDLITIRWRGREISRLVPSMSCYVVPRIPPDGYPWDQGALVSNLARDTRAGDPVPGLLLVIFDSGATHAQRARIISSIKAQVVGGTPEPTPARWWLLVPDDSLGSRVRELHALLKRSPFVRRVTHERLLPGLVPVRE